MDHFEYQRGIQEAQDDITKNIYRLFIQTRGSWGRRLTEVMQEEFRVEVLHISDMANERKSSFEEGYNTTIIAHLDAKYGAGTWDRIWEENQAYRRVESDRINNEIIT